MANVEYVDVRGEVAMPQLAMHIDREFEMLVAPENMSADDIALMREHLADLDRAYVRSRNAFAGALDAREMALRTVPLFGTAA